MGDKKITGEEFTDIPGYDGLYGISRTGVVVSFQGTHPRILTHNRNKRSGVHSVLLCRDGMHRRHVVARLIAEVYISNPDNYQCVRVRDGNQDNLNVDNLEWGPFNNSKGLEKCHTPEAAKKRSETMLRKGYIPKCIMRRKISAYDGKGTWVATVRSIKDAERMINRKTIGQALETGCRAGGYYWRYEEDL